MGLFKGMKDSRERQKAKAFYDTATSEPSNARDARKTKSILGNRCNAFIDLTFIEGAKKPLHILKPRQRQEAKANQRRHNLPPVPIKK